MNSKPKPRQLRKMINVIEVISGAVLYGGPYTFEQAYEVRDRAQETALSDGYILTQYRYAVRLIDG